MDGARITCLSISAAVRVLLGQKERSSASYPYTGRRAASEKFVVNI
jgi:hypothetical protein